MLNIRRVRFVVLAAGLLAALPAGLLAQEKLTPQEESQQLIATLQSADAPLFDKAKACQRLAAVGTADAVPVLAGLLADETLAHYARFGLEPMPYPAAGEALREALGKLEGKLLVGVINSIGMRRDAQAVDALVKLLDNADAEVAAAAAAALGRIATPEASKALQQALASATAIRTAVADACLVCAERLMTLGKQSEAVALFDTLGAADVPNHVRVAATRGAILARQADGLPLLIEKLKSDDFSMCAVALHTAREMTGSEVTQALIAELGNLPEDRRALVIYLLGDRPDPAALPVVLEAAKSATGQVRLAAIRVLAKVGNASAVPVLLDAAVGNDAEVAQAARTTLAEIRGKGVDEALVATLEKSDGPVRLLVIDLIGQRLITSAVPALRKAADSEDPQVRQAAITSLGKTIGLEDLSFLIDRLISPKTPEEVGAVQEALKAACLRATDREACAEMLQASMSRASLPVKTFLLQLLGSLGGQNALEAVVAAAKTDDEKLKDAATRVLGEWMSADAAPALLELARTERNNKYKIRSLRGYIRIARQLDLSPAERIAMSRQAMEVAERNDEKRLALDVLSRVHSAAALKEVLPYLRNQALKETASEVALKIAEKIVQSKPAAVAEAMEQVLQATGNADRAARAKTLLNQAKKQRS